MPPTGMFGGKRRLLRAVLLLSPLALVTVWLLVPVWHIEVVDRDSGKKYFASHVQQGDLVRLSWVHSIEHTPWVEIYEVSSGGSLALKEARIKSFGAGVDQIAPKVAHEDGWVVLRGTERIFPALHFIYSREVAYDLRVGGRELELDERVPQHAALRVEVKQRPRALWWVEANSRKG